MELVFDSNALPERDRHEIWREEFMRGSDWTFDVERRGTFPFEVQVYGRMMGKAMLLAQRATPCAVNYGAREIARLERPWLFLVLTLSGGFVDRHAGGMTRVKAGDLVLHDLTQPFHCESMSSRHHTLGIRLPLEDFSDGLTRPIPAVLKLDRNNANVNLLANYLRSLPLLDATAAAQHGDVYVAHVRDLLRIALRGDSKMLGAEEGQGQQAALALAARQYIKAHLRDPDLSPGRSAKHLGISVRRLHQLFEETGCTFSEHVWRLRLAACHAALSDPAQHWRTIAEIAFAYGFNSLSHFCRRFKAAYGVSPREVRIRPAAKAD